MTMSASVATGGRNPSGTITGRSGKLPGTRVPPGAGLNPALSAMAAGSMSCGGPERSTGHLRHLLNSAAIGSTDWHSSQRKWPVRRSRVRAHGTAPFAATIAETRHQTARIGASAGRPASATARAAASNPGKQVDRYLGPFRPCTRRERRNWRWVAWRAQRVAEPVDLVVGAALRAPQRYVALTG